MKAPVHRNHYSCIPTGLRPAMRCSCCCASHLVRSLFAFYYLECAIFLCALHRLFYLLTYLERIGRDRAHVCYIIGISGRSMLAQRQVEQRTRVRKNSPPQLMLFVPNRLNCAQIISAVSIASSFLFPLIHEVIPFV